MKDTKLSAKKRDKKVFITDIAIDKIPFIKYRGLRDTENQALYQLAKLVLLTSQTENDSNEAAVTCTLDRKNPLEEIGISFGNEHEVDICADTVSNHLIVSARKCAVIVLHNHPSTHTLSITDIRLFLHYTAIKIIVVVTNQGNIHYLSKDDDYDYNKAKALYNECVEGLAESLDVRDFYLAGLTFLSRCSEAGLFYR